MPLPLVATTLADRYAIAREIGRGGMATVYLAEDRKHGRNVAIKVLRAEISASMGPERFLREIGIAARLAHPHLVPLIDSGESDGLLYYVSSYIDGGSLRDRLRRDGALPVRDAIRIAGEVATGLDYVHRNGFVHRDVKPENILFADGHAVLADFGIARACAGPEPESLTDAGLAVGTPEYMSPEQASGDSQVGSASDIYSLACVVFEMLAGEPPLRGSSARTTIAKQVTETARSVRAVRPEAPASLDRALARALSKDPAFRHPSAAEFAAALEQTELGDSGQLLAVTPTRLVAVLPFVNGSPDPENEYLSDGITDELIDALAKVDGLRVASRTSVFALKGKPQDVRAIGALLGASEVLEGTVRRAGDRLRITAQLTSTADGRLLWSQRYDRRLDDVFAIEDEIARTIVDRLRATWFAELAEPVARRYTANLHAHGLYLKGRYAWNKRSQEGVAEGIRYFEQAIAEDPSYALAYTGLSDSYALHIDYRSVPVTEGMARAKAYARTALALDESLAEAHASLAWCYFIHDWAWDDAAAEFQRAIELNPRYAPAHQWYAMLLMSQARWPEAIRSGRTSVELDPASVSARRGLGWLYFYARRFDEARTNLERAIEMNPTAEESYRILGLTLAEQGRFDDAERVLRESAQLPGAGAYARSALGYALARGGARGEAQALATALEAEASRGYVSPVALATLYAGLDEADRALAWAQRAYEERRGWLAYLRVNPVLDRLRRDPRFEALVTAMRFTRAGG